VLVNVIASGTIVKAVFQKFMTAIFFPDICEEMTHFLFLYIFGTQLFMLAMEKSIQQSPRVCSTCNLITGKTQIYLK
jgi:hypothetical protein